MRSNSTPGQTAGRNIRAISPSPEGIDLKSHVYECLYLPKGCKHQNKTKIRKF